MPPDVTKRCFVSPLVLLRDDWPPSEWGRGMILLEERDRGGEALSGLPVSGVMVVDTGRLTSSSVGASCESLPFHVPFASSHSDPDIEAHRLPLMRLDTCWEVLGAEELEWVLLAVMSICVGESEGVTIALKVDVNPSLGLPGDADVLSPFRASSSPLERV